MEAPLTTSQFLQIVVLVGLPVHLGSCVAAGFIARRRLGLSWLVVSALLPVWFSASVVMQIFFWAVGPDLPEEVFMLLNFINLPALAGSMVLLGLLVLVTARRS